MTPEVCERIKNQVKVFKTLTSTHRHVEFTVGARWWDQADAGDFLMALCPRYEREFIERWARDGRLSADGVVIAADARLAPGQKVELHVPLPPPDPGFIIPPLEVLWADEHLACLNKASGHLAHQAGQIMTGTLLNQIQDWHQASTGGPAEDIRLVNRIDRDTSGIVLASRHLAAHVALSAALMDRQVDKEYLAICHGVPNPRLGHWRFPIGIPKPGSSLRCVQPGAQESHTEFLVEDEAPGFALLRLKLHTGRQHQIRVHAAHAGHPLVGDWCYGQPCAELPGQALHAARLAFAHPLKPMTVNVEAPLRDDLARLWAQVKAGTPPTPRDLTEDQQSKLRNGR